MGCVHESPMARRCAVRGGMRCLWHDVSLCEVAWGAYGNVARCAWRLYGSRHVGYKGTVAHGGRLLAIADVEGPPPQPFCRGRAVLDRVVIMPHMESWMASCVV